MNARQIAMLLTVTESINERLRENAIGASDWNHQRRVDFLYAWCDRFAAECGLRVGTPSIRLEPIRRDALGAYRPCRNGFGLKHEITFSSRHPGGSVVELLDTCCHELLHFWHELHGMPPAPNSGNYHNVAFRRKTESLGLLVDSRGRSQGIRSGPFTALLTKHGIDVSEIPVPVEPITVGRVRRPPLGTSKLKKWSCGCTNVRAAVDVAALCLRCRQVFERQDI